ncbi:MAG: lactonase family protein [Fuerstiella sp.]
MRLLTLLLFLSLLNDSITMAAEHRLYIGTYTRGDSASDGIYTCVFDDASGVLSKPELAAVSDNPSFLAVHPTKDLVFACNESNDFGNAPTGAASAFRVDRPSGQLTLINQQPAGGGATCHCVVDRTGRFLLVANYLGGNVAVLPINDDGSLSERSCLINHIGSGPNKDRQEKPHAHSVNLSSDNRFAWVADLGIDRIMIYRFDPQNGLLAPSAADSVAVNPGGGPRHFSLHPSGKFAYANNELTSEVTAFSVDGTTGALSTIHRVSTLPPEFEGRRSTAECLVHPSGKFVYVSNRGHDSIAVYQVNADSGRLTPVEIEKTNGQEPRNFVIDPSGRWLLAENQNSDNVTVFAIAPNNGALAPTNHRIDVPRPVCIRILPPGP